MWHSFNLHRIDTSFLDAYIFNHIILVVFNLKEGVMYKDKCILTLENSLILRGTAILGIMFHNFLHIKRFGYCSENEMSFIQDKADIFLMY